MIEAVLRSLAPVWTPHVEVPVQRPVRGVIDLVLEHREDGLFVATEAYSDIGRLEQQVRWSMEKASALARSDLATRGPEALVSRMLILRSTQATRDLARRFEATLSVAYPARTSELISSLRNGTAWPGAGIAWIRIKGERVELLDRPPRNVRLGR
jgi:hypothetical protein